MTLYDYIETENEICLVMEYVDGIDLSEMVLKHSGPISEDKLLPIFKQMLAGIGYAHKNNVIHRDIKPSNFIITKDGTVKVLDFGIAKLLEDDQQLTKTGMRLGTTTYMSPEQVDAGKVDHRTDIYSLGVTLFVLATGVSPYEGITSEFQVYNKIVNEPLPKASSVYPEVSPMVDRMIEKATEKDPNRRFQQCKEILEEGTVSPNVVTPSKRAASKPIGRIVSTIIVSLATIVLCVLIGIFINNQGSDDSASAIGEKFLTLMAKGDVEGAKKFASKDAQTSLEMMKGTVESKETNPDIIVVGRIEEEGDHATLYYTENGSEKTLFMVKENNDWKASWSKAGGDTEINDFDSKDGDSYQIEEERKIRNSILDDVYCYKSGCNPLASLRHEDNCFIVHNKTSYVIDEVILEVSKKSKNGGIVAPVKMVFLRILPDKRNQKERPEELGPPDSSDSWEILSISSSQLHLCYEKQNIPAGNDPYRCN